MQLVVAIVPGLSTSVRATNSANRDRVISAEGVRGWSSNVEKLLQFASDGRSKLQEVIQQRAEEKRRFAEARAVADAARVADLSDARRQLTAINARIDANSSRVAELDTAISSKESEARSYELSSRENEGLAETAANTAPGGCGPTCRSYKEKASKARDSLVTTARSIELVKRERAALNKTLDELKVQIPVLNQRIASRSAQDGTSTAAPDSASVELASAMRGLRDGYAAFLSEPGWSTLQKVMPLCEAILSAVRDARMEAGISSDFTCAINDQKTKDLLDNVDALQAGRREFVNSCELDGMLHSNLAALSLRVRDNQFPAADALIHAKDLVEVCIARAARAGLSTGELQSFFRDMEAFVRDNTLDRNKLAQASAAFFTRDRDTTLAWIAAAMQNLFMLFLAFFSEFFRQEARRETPEVPP
jgi:hypothetical protein